MKKIYEELPIKLWIEIARKVKSLNFSEHSEKEFFVNLKKMIKLFSNTELDLSAGSRNAVNKEEIGLSILLHMIYQIETEDKASKGTIFHKRIRELLNLGIKTIEFLPVEFYKEISLEQTINNGTIETLNKSFTDGEFEFYRYGKNCENLKICNIKNANYVLKFDMKKEKNNKLMILDSKASLRTFNGKVPSKEEIKKEAFPEIEEIPPRYFFETNPSFSKQRFSIYDSQKKR